MELAFEWKGKRYRKNEAYVELEPKRTYAYAGDYCSVGASAMPQFGMTPEQEEYERQQAALPEDQRDPEPPDWFWIREHSSIVLSSHAINRDFQPEPSPRQLLFRALQTPETFPIPKGHKLCLGMCGEVRAFDKFSPKHDSKDGLHPYCKSCRNEQMRKSRANKQAA